MFDYTSVQKARSFVAVAGAAIILGLPAMAYGDCVSYIVETSGGNGEGGIRFMHDAKNFKRVSQGGRVAGEVCDRDSVEVELAKQDVNTSVNMTFDGEFFQFEGGDAGDKNSHNWYRKYYTLDVN